MVCPLCKSQNTQLFKQLHNQDYYQCAQCFLIFLDPLMRASKADEKQKYDQHHNDPNDSGYRNFLQPAVDVVLENVSGGSYGLDFGSGPGPTVSVMLEEAGMKVENFDPFYAPDHNLLTQKYDFITCTEVAEHLFDPMKEFQLLLSMLKPKGFLVIMTLFFDDASLFSGSHYHRDPTHVCFYSTRTFQWIAKQLKVSVAFSRQNIACFRR